jgi:hypothetical protein
MNFISTRSMTPLNSVYRPIGSAQMAGTMRSFSFICSTAPKKSAPMRSSLLM